MNDKKQIPELEEPYDELNPGNGKVYVFWVVVASLWTALTAWAIIATL